MLDLFLIIIFTFLGVLTGILTGLIPGLHVNNIALIMLSLTPTIFSSLYFLTGLGFPKEFIFLLISIFIIGISVSHTFHDFIPTTFIGAPDADTALSVLPAHKLMLQGKGYESIVLSGMGSFGAIIFCFLVFIPARYLLGKPFLLYEELREIMPWLLIAISLIMICTEKAKIDIFSKKGKIPSITGILFAFFVFILSGIFGLAITELTVFSPIGLFSPVLFPALTGLFGVPALIDSLQKKPNIPKQNLTKPEIKEKNERKSSIFSIITGSIGGILVSIIPGITSATGTVLAMNMRGQNNKENEKNDFNEKQTIMTLSSVNTASAFFVIVVLFIILRPRSGAAIAVNDLIAVQQWNALSIPLNLSYILISLILSGLLSYFFVLKTGKIFAKYFTDLPYLKVVEFTLILVFSLVFIFTGFTGLLILVVATFIGLMPVYWGVRRSHCMGVLLIPIILFFI
ncbi:MAG: tripartite tricarboxylate transporter permease [Candidatus Thermoplasmatota archaeon]